MPRLTGGCLCGAVRYSYEGEVGAAGYCHCADCRKVSGSAFGVSVRVAAAGFRVTSGSPKGFTKAGDSGTAGDPVLLRRLRLAALHDAAAPSRGGVHQGR